MFNPELPYNDLPRLPPEADIETKAILKACIDAKASLAGLKAMAKRIPNQEMLINIIPMLEAQASSEIENIVTTTDRLFQYANDESNVLADPATKEALRYRTALYSGYQSLNARPLTTATAVQICQTIKGVETDIRRVPGTALLNEATRQIVYTPPDGEGAIRDLLADWERFIHTQTDIDPLIRMAVMHYQFEAIHPFSDGNGRTGRVLNLLFLISENLLEAPILYLSRYIIQNKPEYYRRLLRVTTEQEWESWILYMLEATRSTAEWTSKKIIAICDLMDHIRDELRRALPKIYSYELVDVIFTQPYCRIANLVDLGIAQRQTASKILQALVAQNVLREVQVGREKIFINVELMRLLAREDDSAAK
ncbi:protein adenylyltransferase Fic [Advenella mimigardefordensis]|uniref:Putative Fic/Doc family protein n=1 Tax=Advenella mimigardefordensis (strain DSM 17166 / LMG 22922 / DPN7) TaxID=1247726 RepID=W0PI62_ADVMD|nr:Fic family protein [Advenella mimigardefordensis]AHG65497.1 putative Fic/Doc family protein [Advenella mimigardefordensis DPN7]